MISNSQSTSNSNSASVTISKSVSSSQSVSILQSPLSERRQPSQCHSLPPSELSALLSLQRLRHRRANHQPQGLSAWNHSIRLGLVSLGAVLLYFRRRSAAAHKLSNPEGDSPKSSRDLLEQHAKAQTPPMRRSYNHYLQHGAINPRTMADEWRSPKLPRESQYDLADLPLHSRPTTVAVWCLIPQPNSK